MATRTTHATHKSYMAYIRQIRSEAYRKQIRGEYNRLCAARGIDPPVGVAMNFGRREALADAIFAVEDEVESKGGGRPDHPVVLALNRVRLQLNADLGWDDP